MPIYEYECKACASKFEILQRINADNQDLVCPICSASKPTKVFSRFASLGVEKGATSETGAT